MHDTSNLITKFHNKKVTLPPEEQAAMHKRRNATRNRLKKGLDEKYGMKPIGCHSQGSYEMKTMVQDASNDFDIDDGVYFDRSELVGRSGAEKSSLQARQIVCDALSGDPKFKDEPEVKKNCVRVRYAAGYHVDVPVYRRLPKEDENNPDEDRVFELASSEWKASDPKKVTEWFREENSSLSPDSPNQNGGQFRRVVRLLKKFARSRPAWKGRITPGFMLTKLASEEFHPEYARDDVSLRETMRSIKERLDRSTLIESPVSGTNNLADEGDARATFLRDRLKENLPHLDVLDSSDCDDEKARSAWRKVFNNDWFTDGSSGSSSSSKENSYPSEAVKKRGGENTRYAGRCKSWDI